MVYVRLPRRLAGALVLTATASGAMAQTPAQDTTAEQQAGVTPQQAKRPAQLDTVKAEGRVSNLVGIAASANQGTVGDADLALRPLLRPGEIVENVPGVIVTQHSGSGKANQYFLRGFNLDHGTDLALSVDDVPVNMPKSCARSGLRRSELSDSGAHRASRLQEGTVLRGCR